MSGTGMTKARMSAELNHVLGTDIEFTRLTKGDLDALFIRLEQLWQKPGAHAAHVGIDRVAGLAKTRISGIMDGLLL